MREHISVLKKIRNLTLTCSVLYIVIGVLLIAFTDKVQSMMGIMIGASCIFMGIVRLLTYFIRQRRVSVLATDLFSGVILCALGVLCLIYQDKVASVIAVIFGIMLFFGSILKIQNALNLSRFGFKTWGMSAIFAFLSLVLAILIIVNPAFMADYFLKLAGGFLIYDGAAGLLMTLISSIQFHKFRKREDAELEAQAEDVPEYDEPANDYEEPAEWESAPEPEPQYTAPAVQHTAPAAPVAPAAPASPYTAPDTSYTAPEAPAAPEFNNEPAADAEDLTQFSPGPYAAESAAAMAQKEAFSADQKAAEQTAASMEKAAEATEKAMQRAADTAYSPKNDEHLFDVPDPGDSQGMNFDPETGEPVKKSWADRIAGKFQK